LPLSGKIETVSVPVISSPYTLHSMSNKVMKSEEYAADVLPDRVPLKIMQNIWNDKEDQYSDQQLLKMREWVYLLADVIFDAAKTRKRNNSTHLNTIENETMESDATHPGEYRAVA